MRPIRYVGRHRNAGYGHSLAYRLRVEVAQAAGPLTKGYGYALAPKRKRDQWHKIGCQQAPEECATCARYYGLPMVAP